MIFIVCALHCEAKPIIERYSLRSDREAAFPVFLNEELVVVVTGIGKLLTASAMSYAYARYHEPDYAAWLNLGVAGTKSAELGALINVNKVIEDKSANNWYPVRLPQLFGDLNCAVVTVENPKNHYVENIAFDMEASAFMSTALRYSSVELIQLLKIVSDNEKNPLEEINKKQVTMLIENKISQINSVIEALQKNIKLFDENYGESSLYEQCITTWRFSEYQKKHLGRILNQWLALDDGAGFAAIEGLQSAKQVVGFINAKLSVSDIDFND